MANSPHQTNYGALALSLLGLIVGAYVFLPTEFTALLTPFMPGSSSNSQVVVTTIAPVTSRMSFLQIVLALFVPFVGLHVIGLLRTLYRWKGATSLPTIEDMTPFRPLFRTPLFITLLTTYGMSLAVKAMTNVAHMPHSNYVEMAAPFTGYSGIFLLVVAIVYLTSTTACFYQDRHTYVDSPATGWTYPLGVIAQSLLLVLIARAIDAPLILIVLLFVEFILLCIIFQKAAVTTDFYTGAVGTRQGINFIVSALFALGSLIITSCDVQVKVQYLGTYGQHHLVNAVFVLPHETVMTQTVLNLNAYPRLVAGKWYIIEAFGTMSSIPLGIFLLSGLVLAVVRIFSKLD